MRTITYTDDQQNTVKFQDGRPVRLPRNLFRDVADNDETPVRECSHPEQPRHPAPFGQPQKRL